MATIYDHTCLTSSVKNISGEEIICSFLPPHGRTLAAGESVEIVGDIWAEISRGTRSNRKRKALQKALDDGILELTSTPAPIIIDSVTGASKIVKLTSGTLGVEDPCWETSLSESDEWV